jgi:biotin/methionine sulfoxide reductase
MNDPEPVFRPGSHASRALPHSSHWGAFSVLPRHGGVEIVPYPDDPDPSPLLGNISAAVAHRARIARPMVRRGWLADGPGPDRRRGRDEFVVLSWPRAFDLAAAELRRVYQTYGPRGVFGGSYGWASAGRFHDAQSQLHRFLNLAGGYVRSVGSYSSGAAGVLLPHVIGPQAAVAGNNGVSWAELVAESAVVLAFGGMALKNNDVGSGGTSRHIARGQIDAARAHGVEFHLIGPLCEDLPAEAQAVWHSIRPGTDVALMLGLAHTLMVEGRHDCAFLDRYCVGWPEFKAYLSGADGRPAQGCRLGGGDLRYARRRDRRPGAAGGGGAHSDHLLAILAARPAWRAADLDGDRPGRDARPDRPARRRLCLCPGIDVEHRQAATGGTVAGAAAGP